MTLNSGKSARKHTFESQFDCRKTMDRLEAAVVARGMKLFARIDFRRDAEEDQLELPDTELLIFGNPNVGTILLQENRHVGIELPLKVLVFTNPENETWLEFIDPLLLAEDYGIDRPGLVTLTKMQTALMEASREAIGKVPLKTT